MRERAKMVMIPAERIVEIPFDDGPRCPHGTTFTCGVTVSFD